MAISRKTFTALAAGLTLAWVPTAPTLAQTVTQPTLEKIKASGKVVLGVRETSPPMAYALGANEKYVGYHVELCERVLKEIVPQAKLEYMAVTAQNTLPLVQNGTLDIGCGPTTNNTARQQQRTACGPFDPAFHGGIPLLRMWADWLKGSACPGAGF